MDVAGIAPGLDFRKAIDDNVSGCGVFLAIIGAQWATITGADGQRRLDSADDFVRLEVASALNRNIAVIPVLVHEARMPHPEQLPDNIKDLAYRNSVEISHARWNSDVQLLVKALGQYVLTTSATQNEPVHATVPVQLPPPVSTPAVPATKKSNLPLMVGGGVAAAVVLGVLGFLFLHKSPAPASTPSSTPATADAGTGSAAAVAPPASAPPSSGSVPSLAGSWRTTRAGKGGDAVVELHITGTAPNYTVEAIGNCPQGECSWGTQPLDFTGGQGSATWAPRAKPADIQTKRISLITLRQDGENLDMEMQNRWTTPAGQAMRNELNIVFARAQ